MKHRNLFMSATLMCGLLTIAFRFDNERIYWFWTGHEIAPIILGISSLIFGGFWIVELYKQRHKM